MKKTNRLDISPYTPFDDIQALVRPISMPWTSLLDGFSDSIYPLGVDDLSDALKNYSSLAELYRVPDYLASSALLRFNYEDNLLASETPSQSDFTRGDGSASPSGDTTSAFDVNKTNQEYLDYLRTRTEEVTYAIAHTAFEDGMDNDVTVLLKSFAKKNKSSTYNWLDELYSKNLNNPSVVGGILRSLAMITDKGDENILLPIVVAALRSGVSVEQEAAIMVIEEWRTKECLNAIRSVHSFASDLIEDYAMMVADELEKELTIC